MNRNEKRTVALILMFASVYVISASPPVIPLLTNLSGGVASIIRFKFIHGLAIPRDEFFGKNTIYCIALGTHTGLR